ncbi:MAG: hypothetical protein HKM95_08075 [Inquilinus sp.]|nr:hypothetical protein [Inquilinus sp.]
MPHAQAAAATVNKAFQVLLTGEKPEDPCRYRFALDGVDYSVALTLGEERFHYRITARVGTRPYSAENADARVAIAEILRQSRELDRAHFLSDRHQGLWAYADRDAEGSATPDAVVHETLLFLQEARPFIRLLADYA